MKIFEFLIIVNGVQRGSLKLLSLGRWHRWKIAFSAANFVFDLPDGYGISF